MVESKVGGMVNKEESNLGFGVCFRALLAPCPAFSDFFSPVSHDVANATFALCSAVMQGLDTKTLQERRQNPNSPY